MSKSLTKNKGPGRPAGRKNNITLLKEHEMKKALAMATSHMMEHLPKLVKTLVDKAQDGDMQAMKMIMDRVIPTRKAIEHTGSSERPMVNIQISTGALPNKLNDVIDGEVVEDG